MLLMDRASGAIADRSVRDLPALLEPGDLLVLNDTRVLPARLYATRAGARTQAGSPLPSGRIEVLLTHPQANEGDRTEWNALVRPAKKVLPGERLLFSGADGEPVLTAEVIAAGDFGERRLRFDPVADFTGAVERIGHMPLPPYIRRVANEPDTAEDRERYQTVYSRRQDQESGRDRSAAAPTAGLHFTEAMLDRLRARGVEIAAVTLHVGLGTFQPVRVAATAEIRLHAERYTLPPATAEALNRARRDRRRIVAVGTTTTRTLEHCALEAERQGGAEVTPGSGETSLFLSPGAPFRLVSGLLTNFHLPESTLLMLVSAFAGREAVLAAYAHAVEQRYRFFSYGDCMLIL